MASDYTPQIAQACERWVGDKVLIDLLEQKEMAALRALGDALDPNTMLRAQGVYKSFVEMRNYINGGVKAAAQFRAQARVTPGAERSIESIVLGT